MKNIIFATIIGCIGLLYACQSNTDQRFLKEALLLVDNNPEQALLKLDSIQDPKGLDTDSYMHYILTNTQAKYKTCQDIALDSLILRASAYFDTKKESLKAATAHYYTGYYYYENDMIDSSFLHFKKAIDQAKLAKDTLLLGKNNNSIAYLYFENGNMDSAIIYYEKALFFYTALIDNEEVKIYEININRQLGIAYSYLKDYTKSYIYFQKGLEESEKNRKKDLQSKFNLNIGVVFLKTGKYEEAKKYLGKALPNAPNFIDSTKIYLNLANLYYAIHRIDSASYCTKLVEERLPIIEDNYTLERVYNLLANHYKNKKDYDKAIYYQELENAKTKEITAKNNKHKFSELSKDYELSINKLEQANTRKQTIFYTTIAVLLLIFISIVVYLRFKTIRFKFEKEQKEKQFLKELYLTRVKNIRATQTIFKKLSVDWDAIEKEVDTLAVQFNAQKPTIYNQIRSLIADIKDETDKQLIGFVQDFLVCDGYTGDFRNLSKKDLLLTGFCYMKLSNNEISKLINIPTQRVYPSKLNLKHKLKDHGLTNDQIESILFDENKKHIE